MMPQPTALQMLDPQTLEIKWSNQTTRRYPVQRLRDGCPCATCREKRSADEENRQSNPLPVIPLAEAQPMSITGMKPVGNYAYSIAFSDGHDTGIFSFELLREMGEPVIEA